MKGLYTGDCLEVLAGLPENSVDTCITDPPYGLGFMGKQWDTFDKSQFGVAGNEGENDLKVKKSFNVLPRYRKDGLYDFTFEWAQAVYRVLKPGAILLAFGGTRTYHRMVCAIEDAGFEIRDTIAWVYGSGFPKSYNIGKGIEAQMKTGRSSPKGQRMVAMGDEYEQTPLAGTPNYGVTGNFTNKDTGSKPMAITTPEAQFWHGWGTALKPAFEPIVVAMKPIDGTFVNNALTWGVAGLNVDGGRVGFQDDADYQESTQKNRHGDFNSNGGIRVPTKGIYHGDNRPPVNYEPSKGRFPANFIHDGSDEVVGLFPQTKSGNLNHGHKRGDGTGNSFMGGGGIVQGNYGGDSGSAARFFYCAKSSRRERNNGLDSYVTVKYNNDKSNNGGISWKDASTVAVQLLRRVISESVTLSFNIGESGESITVLCPKDSLSITLTAINKIIESKTLHSLTLSLTNEYTAGVNYEMVNGGSPAESVESLRKWILTTTNGHLELARGASSAALNMLLRIKNADAWSQATNIHSTVKPLALMRYLVRLTKTPTGGVVLDPFMGSGTTGCACALEGREFIGIEREQEYIEIAEKRIAYWSLQPGLEVE